MESADRDDLGLELQAGTDHYRSFVGPPADYDLIAGLSAGLLFHSVFANTTD